MDIGKSFESSWALLRNNKKLLFPAIIHFIISSFILYLFLFSTGIYKITKDIVDSAVKFSYERQHTWDFKQREALSQKFMDDLKSRGISFDSVKKFLLDHFAAIILTAAAIILLSLAKVVSQFMMVSNAIQEKEIKTSSILRSIPKFILRYLLLIVLCFLIYFVPVFLSLIIIIIMFAIHYILGLLIMLPMIFGIFAFLVYVTVKTVFSVPVMFIENETPLNSIKKSINATRGTFWMCLSSTVGSEAWNSRDLKSRPH